MPERKTVITTHKNRSATSNLVQKGDCLFFNRQTVAEQFCAFRNSFSALALGGTRQVQAISGVLERVAVEGHGRRGAVCAKDARRVTLAGVFGAVRRGGQREARRPREGPPAVREESRPSHTPVGTNVRGRGAFCCRSH